MNNTFHFSLLSALGAVGIATLYILLTSRVKEPDRQKLSAIIVAGAGAVYLNGGLGVWEFGFCIFMTFIAFKGLTRYWFIGLAWMMHTVWDLIHHFYGNPIIYFAPDSSAGCAVCDAILAVWFFAGAPSPAKLLQWNTTSKVKI